ncbi:stage V sporulation protein B [Lachnospiraceae bacterium XBB1006]|nr:stage V sporulation protein B [Lachnospiraceae bacterium XBB1006]
MGSSRKNNFVMQASILAIAGIVSRIIGLLYRGPLHAVIGDVGLGFYQSAYAFYTIILLISSYSIPSAISKIIAQKLALKEYKNAHRLFRGAMLYVMAIGALFSVVLYLGAEIFVEKDAIWVLRAFAPTIFLYGILGVLRGYFQAHGSMIQTSVSQIVEQIVNAVVSIGGAYLLIKHLMGTMTIPEDEAGKVQRGIFGAVGSALGTGAGVLVALLFMLVIYGLNRNFFRKRRRQDMSLNEDSYMEIFKVITFTVVPFILSTAVYNLSGSINTKIYTGIYKEWKRLSALEVQTAWGIFSGQALTIANIPIAFASAMSAAMIPSISALIVAEKVEEAKRKIAMATRVTMVVAIPCAVGMLFLAEPLIYLLFQDTAESLVVAGKLLGVLTPSVIFYALSTLNSAILQGINQMKKPIYNAAIALVAQTICVGLLLRYTTLGIYGVAIANTVYSGIMAWMNQHATKRAIGYRQELLKTFAIPLCASGIMGIVVLGGFKVLQFGLRSMRIATILAVCLGIVVYGMALLLLKGVSEEEILQMPKGEQLARFLKRLKLLKGLSH